LATQSIRFFSVILFSLFLSACEEEPKETYDALNAREAQVMTQPFWDLPPMGNDDIEATRKGLLEGRCKPLTQHVSKHTFLHRYPVLAARLAMDGTCTPIRAGMAELWLDEAVFYGSNSPEALYLLGEIKLKGANHPPNVDAANLLFRKAVMVAAPSYFYLLDREKLGMHGANDPVAWGLKASEMIRRMATVINEPRKTPPEFAAHLDWLDSVYLTRDAEKIIAIAKGIRAEKSVGPHSLWTAFEWLDYADYKLGSDEAKMTKLRWLLEPEIESECVKHTLTDCNWRARDAKVFELLIEATTIFNDEATQAMRCLFKTVEDAKTYQNLTGAWKRLQAASKSLQDAEELAGKPLRFGKPSLRWTEYTYSFFYEVNYMKSLGAALTKKIDNDYLQLSQPSRELKNNGKFSVAEIRSCLNAQ